MDSDKLTRRQNDQALHFDFDEWVELARRDPDAFEQRRIEWCQRFIASAPNSYQRRLAGLLFQINMEKRRSANALDSCIRLSKMMWDRFDELRDELHDLLAGAARRQRPARRNSPGNRSGRDAQILAMPSSRVSALSGNGESLYR